MSVRYHGNMKCPVCGEWASDHRILGEIINPHAWHGVWTGMGWSLVPSMAGKDGIRTSDVYRVRIPRQRKSSLRILDSRSRQG